MLQTKVSKEISRVTGIIPQVSVIIADYHWKIYNPHKKKSPIKVMRSIKDQIDGFYQLAILNKTINIPVKVMKELLLASPYVPSYHDKRNWHDLLENLFYFYGNKITEIKQLHGDNDDDLNEAVYDFHDYLTNYIHKSWINWLRFKYDNL